MVSNLKKQKGSTIVEVLISVIIIGIISIYGLSFFTSAYRVSIDSREYGFVFQDLVRKMEMIKGGQYPPTITDAATHDCYPNNPGNLIYEGNRDRDVYDFKIDKNLRDDCRIHYTCRAYVDTDVNGHHIDNCTQVIITAEWPFDNPDFAPADRNRLTLMTYIASPKNNNIGEF